MQIKCVLRSHRTRASGFCVYHFILLHSHLPTHVFGRRKKIIHDLKKETQSLMILWDFDTWYQLEIFSFHFAYIWCHNDKPNQYDTVSFDRKSIRFILVPGIASCDNNVIKSKKIVLNNLSITRLYEMV